MLAGSRHVPAGVRRLLAHTSRSQTIALEPLDDSQIVALCSELLGDDASIAALSTTIAKRASGNPFFAEELVRDLTERGVLTGQRGAYVCTDPISEVTVPGTLKAVIASRIDRLDPLAKRTLFAAAVIGLRFSFELLQALQMDATLDNLLDAELVDQVTFTPRAEYAFRHPLIRAVAYESQLRSDRAQLHRQLADMIDRDDQNAALIAEHFEAAGDMDAAYEWHMRAGGWSSIRDYPAARASWLRAQQVADQLRPDHPNRMSMRIGPRTMLCGTAFRTAVGSADTGFEELRELCTAAGEKSSLAIGMAGLVAVDVVQNRIREASALASECMTLLESIGDPELTLRTPSVASLRSCSAARWRMSRDGRRPSSTSPPETRRRAVSSSRRRLRRPSRGAPSVGGDWVSPAGGRTSTAPSRWHEVRTCPPRPSCSLSRMASPFREGW